VIVLWLPARGLAALVHFGRRLPQARGLVAGLALALVAGALRTVWLGESGAWVRVLVNDGLLVLYALLIHVATDPPVPRPRFGLPRVEIAVWCAFATVAGAEALGIHGFWDRALERWILEPVHAWTGLGAPRVHELGRGAWRWLVLVGLPWLLFSLLGQRPRDLGLRPRKLGLGLALVGVGVALHELGLAAAPDPRPLETWGAAVPAFLATLATLTLPLEFFYRSLLLPRLETVLRDPLDALAIAALLYTAAGLPARIAAGAPAGALALDLLGGLGNPQALAWGYLYLRTRSAWPGAFWHASHRTFGGAFS
jgi:membrane protease YdiL (CAAX protease family)